MKDYSMNEKEKETFILNYTENKNNLIVHYASKKDKIRKNNQAEKNGILSRMEWQVKNANPFLKKQEQRFAKAKEWLIICLALLLVGGGITLAGALEIIFVVIFLGSIDLFALYNLATMIDSKIKINDVKKNQLFLKNKNIINESHKEKLTTQNKKSTFDINSIEKMHYKKLKLLLLKTKEKNAKMNISKNDEETMVLTKKLGVKKHER